MADHDDPTPDWVRWASLTFITGLLAFLVGSTVYSMWTEWR